MKHWALCHPELAEAPEFRFSVVKKFGDPLSRMVHEAILIMRIASMNSKSEFKGYKIATLTVNQSEWEKRKEIEISNETDRVELGEVLKLRERVVANARTASNNNLNLHYRKRGLPEMTPKADPKVNADETPEQPPCKKRFTGITSRRGGGTWDRNSSRFIRKTSAVSTPIQRKNCELVTSTPVTEQKQMRDSTSSIEYHSGLSSNASDIEFLLVASHQAENERSTSTQSSNAVCMAAVDDHEETEALANSLRSWSKENEDSVDKSFKVMKSLKSLAMVTVFGSSTVPSLESLVLASITTSRKPFKVFGCNVNDISNPVSMGNLSSVSKNSVRSLSLSLSWLDQVTIYLVGF